MNVRTDTGNVQTEARANGEVFHNIHDDVFGETYSFLTPEQARQVAHELLKAAAEAEARS